MKKELLSEEDLAAIASEIKSQGQDILVLAEMSDPRHYLCNGEYVSVLVGKYLTKRYPGLDDDDTEMISNAVGIILEEALVEIKFFENKNDRDDIIQHRLSPEARKAITNSVTRSTNMRNLYKIFEFLLPGEFEIFTNSIKRLYGVQLKSSDSKVRIENARNVRDITSKFCSGLIAS